MLIAFVGDLHGRVFHAIAALLTWQGEAGQTFDLIVQVGDLGEHTDLRQVELASDPQLGSAPAEADLARLLVLKGTAAGRMLALRQGLAGPIHFIRGNHEDVA